MRRKFFSVAREEAAAQRWTMRSCRDRKRSAFAVNLVRPAFTNLLGRDYTFDYAQGGLMPQRLSEWVQKARARWPSSFRNKGESGIFGEGRYAVLTCAYFHTSACRMMYSEVHLFESLEEALNYNTKTVWMILAGVMAQARRTHIVTPQPKDCAAGIICLLI